MGYSNIQVAVLGLGISGQAAAELLSKEGAMVTVFDTSEKERLKDRIRYLESLGVRVVAAPDAAADHSNYRCAVISPGVDPSSPLVRSFVERRIEMIGELEFASELCRCPIVAITGTNGKTTTTELVAQMFAGAGVKTIAAGNIGEAFSSVVQRTHDLDVLTLEVSSFQLETIKTFHPAVSAWLNFAPDHLDRYTSVEEYRAAKLRIFENQTQDDWAVVNHREELPEIAPRQIRFSAWKQGGEFSLEGSIIHYQGTPVLDQRETQLRGLHNAENLMAAMAIGVARGLSFEKMTPALMAYKPQAHRCERIGTLDGVEYINDSKATNLDSLEKALESQSAPVVLIAGGKDKGFGFESITSLVASKARCAILIGEMAGRIEEAWQGSLRCLRAVSLEDAVHLAREESRAGDVVLFSPGTSSFDMFKDYKDRGDQFRTLAINMGVM